jgi:hyperosmotically inducible periplasmic protein
MSLSLRGFSIVFLLAFVLALGGCEREGTAEKAGRKVDQAGEKAGKAAEKAGEQIDKAAEKAGKEIEEQGK